MEQGSTSLSTSTSDSNGYGNYTVQPKYEIFLSHSGAQEGFVEQLCVDLERCDRYPFFGKRRDCLPKGKGFGQLIFEALEQCQVGVVVLSEEFFTSKWPMMELEAMANGKVRKPSFTIMPIFLGITLSQCSDANNRKKWLSLWHNLAKSDHRIDVEVWANALRLLVSINGFKYNFELGEVKLREEIVEAICILVPPRTRFEDSHVQGRSRLCKVVRERIKQSKLSSVYGVHVVGLYGVGGIGKTAICKAMCNDVSEECRGKVAHMELGSQSEEELLKEVLRRLTNMNLERLGAMSVDEYRYRLRRDMMNVKVFLTIDNVSSATPMQALTLLRANYGLGSVLLVTARSLNELTSLRIDASECMEMPELEMEEARSLFLYHAACVPPEYSSDKDDHELISSCVQRCYFMKGDGISCHYNPLALQALGEQLGRVGYVPNQWRSLLNETDVLNRFQEIEHPASSTLSRSFDGLNSQAQRLLNKTSPKTYPEISSKFSSFGKIESANGSGLQAHQQAPMADYYSRILSCIESVSDRVRGRWQLNEHQCSFVAEELLKVSQSLQAKLVSGNLKLVQGIQKTVLLHLHAAVQRAQLLVERCCCETSANWRVAALTLTDIKEEVITIVLNLHQWTFVLDIAIASVQGRASKENLEFLKTGEEGYQRLFKKLRLSKHPLQVAALEDEKTLLENIAEYTEDDYAYGVYLESRLAPMGEEVPSVPQLEDYKVSRALGHGASGMVLEVTWMGHQCGLKISKAIDKTEATILDRLHHPNIVRFFHYWEVPPPDRNSYMVMELLPSDLQKHILRELSRPSSQSPKKCVGMPFLLSVAIDLMFQVASAMQHVHDQKLTHKDLKTSNILVKPLAESMSDLHSQGYLEAKLADFGSAKGYMDSSISEGLTRNIGTTVYGAPEIFGQVETQTHKNFPPKADVWSFGMVCSEILTGRMPFSEERSKANLHKRIRFDGLRPSLPKDCPAYLQFCITSCWELQPQRRPSFTDLCRMLRHAQLLNLGLIRLEDPGFLFAYSNRAGLTNMMRVNSTSSRVHSIKSRFLGGIGLISSFRKIGRGYSPMQPTIEAVNEGEETSSPTGTSKH